MSHSILFRQLMCEVFVSYISDLQNNSYWGAMVLRVVILAPMS